MVTIRVIIRFRESVPDLDPDPGRTATYATATNCNICPAKIIQQFYYAGVRRRSVLSEYF